MEQYKKYIRNKRYHLNYTHSVLYPGATFRTRNDGECSVLGRTEDKARRGYYVVEFKDSGVVKEAYGSHIKSGAVSDKEFPTSEEEREALLMKPQYYGVGYIGSGKHSTVDKTQSHQRTRNFILWHNMLARCYTINSQGKPFFKGYKGVKVCERWHNFQTFCNDLPALHGYSQWKNNQGAYELDKDYSHRRIYSPDTAAFISTSENAKEVRLRTLAMKIPSENYRAINKMRNEILLETEDELKTNKIDYEINLNGNMKIIISETPYGTVVFYPLSRKIQRNSYITDGDVLIYIHYLNWLKFQWEMRNPCIDCIAVS
ncbi:MULTISPECIES: hypothetical protein [Yersinia]|uniref:Uncharacterized protein n=1 Tax=Yersinia kristensenii TaxID=28152 RepID=A0A0T9KNT4_YERKR|nr:MULTISPECIES: hypothetical protein [Yersinia]MDR5017349.1 hypothetical protein [Yersinia rochesterensis]CNE16494.1 Uncharacterised protein [Yersinia kristensenii]